MSAYLSYWKRSRFLIIEMNLFQLCQFIYYDIKLHSPVSGAAFGLNLVLNIEQYEYLPNGITDAGVKVNSDVMNKHQWTDRRCLDNTRGVFDQIGLNEIVAWIINYIHGFVIHALTTMAVKPNRHRR